LRAMWEQYYEGKCPEVEVKGKCPEVEVTMVYCDNNANAHECHPSHHHTQLNLVLQVPILWLLGMF